MNQAILAAIRILVVDDNPEVLFGTARVLEKAGYTVVQATGGEEALAAVKQQRPELLLLDRDMPRMDGVEVCRQLKRDPALAEIFVIIVSGVSVASDEQAEGLEAGADGYIARPIANRELLARVDAYVRILRLTGSLRVQAEELRASNASIEQARLAALELIKETEMARERSETANEALQREIAERRRAEALIQSQLDELQRWQGVMLDREDRVQELKREVNALCRQAGGTVRYPSQEEPTATGKEDPLA